MNANGLRLHYLEWGSLDNPPAVLFHANGFLAWLWQPIAEILGEEFHVYAYDARGHGDSDPSPNGYGWQNLVDDACAFMEVLRLRQVFAIGHSMGGCVAAQLAIDRPERVSRLVLIEPVILETDIHSADRGHTAAAGARRRRLVWHDSAEMIHSYRRRPNFAHWREDILRLYADQGTFRRSDGQIELKCAGETEAQIFENNASLNTFEELPRIKCPTLVMRGQATGDLLFELAEKVAARVPGARLSTLAGLDHFLVMERPEVVAAEIVDFAARISRRERSG